MHYIRLHLQSDSKYTTSTINSAICQHNISDNTLPDLPYISEEVPLAHSTPVKQAQPSPDTVYDVIVVSME